MRSARAFESFRAATRSARPARRATRSKRVPTRANVEQIWEWLRARHTRGVLCRALAALMDAPARVRSLTGNPDEDHRVSA